MNGDPTPSRLDIVIPVHGKFELTAACLDALLPQSLECTVLVVDDASPDNTLELLAERYPEVPVLPLPTNVGFARASNAGMKHGRSEFILLLNNDVVAAPNLVTEVLAHFADADVGSVAPLVLTPSGDIDAFGITCDRTAAGYLRLHGAPLSRLADADLYALLGPYGAVAAYRRAALDDVGYFDESIFMYSEELDLALRLRLGGWECSAMSAIGGTHLGSGTTQRGSKRQVELGAFGRGYMLRKYSRMIGAAMPRALVVEFLVCVRAVVRDRGFAAIRGRVRGFLACNGRCQDERRTGIDESISALESLGLRAGRWTRTLDRSPGAEM